MKIFTVLQINKLLDSLKLSKSERDSIEVFLENNTLNIYNSGAYLNKNKEVVKISRNSKNNVQYVLIMIEKLLEPGGNRNNLKITA